MYQITCSVCGAKIKLPVEPPAGIDLTCVNCLRKDTPAEKDTAAEAGSSS